MNAIELTLVFAALRQMIAVLLEDLRQTLVIELIVLRNAYANIVQTLLEQQIHLGPNVTLVQMQHLPVDGDQVTAAELG